MNIIIDNEFKALIPPLTTEEYQQLEKNIILEGCRDSLITWNDILIDGHNRHAICTNNDIPFKTSEKAFESREKVKEWIILNQFGRRNLSAYDRSVLALRLKELFADKAKINQLSTLKQNTVCQTSDKRIVPIDTKKELAKVAGVSHDTIAKVQKIEENASTEIKAKIKTGDISINQAYQEIRREEKQQEREIKIQKREIETIDFKCENFVHGDAIEELGKLQDKSIDCIITDPPYGIDYVSNYRLTNDNVASSIKNDGLDEALSLWEKSCSILDKKVKDDCHLYIFTSWKVWHHFREITEKYFKIKNCLIWEKNNWSMGDLYGNYAEQYEMILFATRGNRELIDGRDTNILKFDRVSNQSLLHSCEKPIDLLEFLIQKSTVKGELVADPFAGSGSTLVAAKNLERNFWGCEIEQENHNKALGRLVI